MEYSEEIVDNNKNMMRPFEKQYYWMIGLETE